MSIDDWRRKIDDVDRRLVELLNERASAARQIGLLKRDSQLPIYEPDRERQVFANIKKHNRGPLPERDLMQLYERIIDVMRKVQHEQAIADKQTRATGTGNTELDAEVND
jgi:chorismate mutase